MSIVIDAPWKRVPKTMELPINSIRTDGGTQQRALGISRSHVESLLLAIRKELEDSENFQHPFEPVVAYDDGEHLWLSDGFHRITAYKIAGIKSIVADVRQGTRRDAILHSCRSNSAHGLPRTNEDKRRAVESVLRDPYWNQYSDLQIADICMVSDWLVRDVSRKMQEKGAAPRTAHRISRRGARFDSTTFSENGKIVAKKAHETKTRRKIERQKVTDEEWLESLGVYGQLKNENNEAGFRHKALIWKRLDELGVFHGIRQCAKLLDGDEQSIAEAVLELYNAKTPEQWIICPECNGTGWSHTEVAASDTTVAGGYSTQCSWCNNPGGFIIV